MGILKDKERMCYAHYGCHCCQIGNEAADVSCTEWIVDNEERAIEIVNEWVENNPDHICDNCIHNLVCRWSEGKPDGCSYYSKPHIKIQYEGEELSISEVTNMLTNMKQELKQLKEYYRIGED